jgi:hypothetical protein
MKILIPSAVCPVTELVEVLPWSLIFRIDKRCGIADYTKKPGTIAPGLS